MITHYLDVPGGQIAYDDQGSGPLVICVPGMGDLRGEYRFLAPQLARAGYRVVCMDVRGHGDSSVGWDDYTVGGVGSDALALSAWLKAGPAVIIGTSMAGGAAVWAAAEGPGLVRGIVLIGPYVSGESSLVNRLLYRLLFSRPWGPFTWKTFYTSLYRTRKPEDFEEYTAQLQANLQEKGRLEALHQMLAASKIASETRLGRVRVPALVLMGARDPDFKNPRSEAQWIAKSLDAEYHMITGAGHYPQAEMVELTVPLILKFLRSLK